MTSVYASSSIQGPGVSQGQGDNLFRESEKRYQLHREPMHPSNRLEERGAAGQDVGAIPAMNHPPMLLTLGIMGQDVGAIPAMIHPPTRRWRSWVRICYFLKTHPLESWFLSLRSPPPALPLPSVKDGGGATSVSSHVPPTSRASSTWRPTQPHGPQV